MKYFIFINLCLIVFGVPSYSQTDVPSMSQNTLVQLADTVNRRLGYMKDVAGFKAQNHLPVEDIAQEIKVVNSSLSEAESLGLDPESTRLFIVAQIDAAKAIQYRYRADWLAVPEIDWQPQPLEAVRQRIADLSSEILKHLALCLKDGCIEPNERDAFILQLEQNHLSCADKKRLFNALLFVRQISIEE